LSPRDDQRSRCSNRDHDVEGECCCWCAIQAGIDGVRDGDHCTAQGRVIACGAMNHSCLLGHSVWMKESVTRDEDGRLMRLSELSNCRSACTEGCTHQSTNQRGGNKNTQFRLVGVFPTGRRSTKRRKKSK
jgi:hypothetical protein